MSNKTQSLFAFNGSISSNSCDIRLDGLDGTNPLGFLAALGLFRVVTQSATPTVVRISWVAHGGTWVPLLSGIELTRESLLDLLADRFDDETVHPATELFSKLGVQDYKTRRAAIRGEMQGTCCGEMNVADWIAAIASDVVAADAINQLQTVRRDYFSGNIRSILDRTQRSHLDRAIFRPWDYADALDNQSLHLDPTEDRRHAHQWDKPSGDPNRKSQGGMLGANRLAIEAIPLFVSVPVGETLRTLGFSGNRSYDTRWTWPIWKHPISLDTVKSLLASQELQTLNPTAKESVALQSRGIVAAYRTHRILVGKTPNFTPPERIA